MTSLRVGLVTVALVGGSIAAALGVRSCVAQRAAVDLQLEAVAFERGTTFGLELAAAVETSPDCSAVPLPAELSALVACKVDLQNYRRTEAANRANARLLGLNDGMRISREDWWIVQPWECPRR